MTPKKQGLVGMLIAIVLALPLFVFSTMNLNYNLSEKAQYESPTNISKGGNENYDSLINSTPLSIIRESPKPLAVTLPSSNGLENQFFNKYAMYVFAGFLVFIITTILLAIKAHNKNVQK